MTEPDLRLRAVVPAPPKVVYEALTDPAALRVWLAEHADVDLPGKYEFWAATRRTALSRTSACCTWTSAPSGSPGPYDWVPRVHAYQLQRLAETSGRDGTLG